MGDIGSDGPATVRPKTVHTFDELIRERALDEDQTPLIAFPKTKLGIDDYEVFSGRELNRLVDGAAKALIKAGIEPVYEDTVAAIYGTSDLDFIITVFGLGRLGYTTFIISPRLPVNAIVNLVSPLNTTTFLHGSQYSEIASKTAEEIPLKLAPILTREQYDLANDATAPFARTGIDGEKETLRILIMMHSSGSTGLPKPVHFTHKRLLATLLTAQHLTAFCSVPLFHAHGFVSFVQAIYTRKVIFMFNGNVPQTHDTVKNALIAARPEVVWTVPYVLKLLAEKKDGIEALKQCKLVSTSGSRCPDELGDMIVNEGIHFGTAFGATEVALILTSLNRPREDKAWNYLRPPPHIAPFIYMKPFDGEVCECVVLDGHKGKLKSNSNDPPNSWYTNDLFVPHSTIPNAWKFVGRADDRVTLTNGEKVLPLPIEGRIIQHPLVKEAVVFGIDRPVPGLLLFRAKTAAHLNDEELLDKVWPTIEDANSHAEAFSQISRDMIAVIPDDIDCPSTDKSSIKRAAVYKEFASIIDDVYTKLESSMQGTLKFDVVELEQWILKCFDQLGVHIDRPDTDFFSAGVDSLKAIQMRGLIIKNLDLGGNGSKCAPMIVYDCGNATKLAKSLYTIRTGEILEGETSDKSAVMGSMIEKYSIFNGKAYDKAPKNHVVVLTGVTGSLGSHLLANIINLPHVSKIYCLLRTSSPTQTAASRLTSALESRNLQGILSSEKIVPISSDLSKSDFGIPSDLLAQLRSETTHIIHCAWAVNFALPIEAFQPQLYSLQNLINLSLSTQFSKPAHLLFCSSVGTAMNTLSEDEKVLIPEAPIADLNNASPTGYARSKLVAEHMLQNASLPGTQANATILRIGQIIPAKATGSQLWNPTEMIPLMVRSALTAGALPDRPGSGASDSCSWIDVDVLAAAIVEIGGIGSLNEFSEGKERQLVYNLLNPKPFSWKDKFLPALKRAGLEFEVVSWGTWLERLKGSDEDVQRNPSRKLVVFWGNGRKVEGNREVIFETKNAEEKSQTLRTAGDIVEGDFVARLVAEWKKVW